MKRWLAILTSLTLGACASLSEEQCRSADWAHQGERDALDGYTLSRVEEHAKACAKLAIVPDRPAFSEGFQRGLVHFCQAQKGFDYAHAGKTYRDTCPADSEAAFQQGYRLGQRLRSEETQRRSVESEINNTEKSLKKAQSEEERTKLRAKLRSLDAALVDHRRALRYLDEDIARAGLRRM